MEAKGNDDIRKWARRSGGVDRVRAMLALARPDLAKRAEQLDQDPLLFNCLNGTLDLRTGALLPHDRAHYITKLAPVAYDQGAKAPTWLSFTESVFDGNQEIVSYVQRLLGYSLTGLITEQCLAFMYGTGANGKTTFLNVAREICGDYAQEAAPDLLLENKFSSIPNDIARLCGARLVTATETSDGRRWDEAKIKRLTGGDRVTARFMRGEFFEFNATPKFWVPSNHKPVVTGQDHAIWRRIKLIPFKVTFLPEQQDRNLPAKLHQELPGILAWAVRGCLDWQQGGLEEPSEIRKASAEYKDEMDALQRFIGECCIVRADAFSTSKDLRSAYQQWAQNTGERPITAQSLGRQLKEKGFTDGHRNSGNGWFGLALQVSSEGMKDMNDSPISIGKSIALNTRDE